MVCLCKYPEFDTQNLLSAYYMFLLQQVAGGIQPAFIAFYHPIGRSKDSVFSVIELLIESSHHQYNVTI